MKVTLTTSEVIEACREWVERHYGFEAKGDAYMEGTFPNNNAVYKIERFNITFPEAPKPEGGPYRTPG